MNYVQERLAELREDDLRPSHVTAHLSSVKKPYKRYLKIVGDGQDTFISIGSVDDLEIVEAVIAKLRRDLAR